MCICLRYSRPQRRATLQSARYRRNSTMILKWPCCWSVVAREYAMLLRVRPVPPISRHPKLGPSRVLSGLFRSPARRLTLRSFVPFVRCLRCVSGICAARLVDHHFVTGHSTQTRSVSLSLHNTPLFRFLGLVDGNRIRIYKSPLRVQSSFIGTAAHSPSLDSCSSRFCAPLAPATSPWVSRKFRCAKSS